MKKTYQFIRKKKLNIMSPTERNYCLEIKRHAPEYFALLVKPSKYAVTNPGEPIYDLGKPNYKSDVDKSQQVLLYSIKRVC